MIVSHNVMFVSNYAASVGVDSPATLPPKDRWVWRHSSLCCVRAFIVSSLPADLYNWIAYPLRWVRLPVKFDVGRVRTLVGRARQREHRTAGHENKTQDRI